MNILMIGSGGREHAFAYKLAQSKLCKQLFIMPGNAGTTQFGQNVKINPNDFAAVGQFSLENKIDLVIVGPEEPLVLGLRNYFEENENLKYTLFVGPDKMGATMEASKDWSKAFMYKNNIPTAAYKTFTNQNLDNLINKSNIIYCRVSSFNQKNDLTSQLKFIEQYCTNNQIHVDDVYSDIGSGLNYKRKGETDITNSPTIDVIVDTNFITDLSVKYSNDGANEVIETYTPTGNIEFYRFNLTYPDANFSSYNTFEILIGTYSFYKIQLNNFNYLLLTCCHT
jgi:hypothetical protein